MDKILFKQMKKIHIDNCDNWATPPDLYNELNARFNFDFDPCPYQEGPITVDGLKIPWGQCNFVNPPYSLQLKEAFIKKAIAEMAAGKTSVFLLPVSTSTNIFHDVIQKYGKIEFLRRRVKFGKLDSAGNFYLPKNAAGKISSGTKDSMIVIFKPKPDGKN